MPRTQWDQPLPLAGRHAQWHISIHQIATHRASRIGVVYRAKTFGAMNKLDVVEVDIAHRLRLSKCVKAVSLSFLGCLKGDALALGRG